MDSLCGELLVSELESLLLLHQHFELILLIRDIGLTILGRKKLIIDVIDFKLYLLHPEHALNTWLGVKTQAHIDALHIIVSTLERL
jgi:hypothetical protein